MPFHTRRRWSMLAVVLLALMLAVPVARAETPAQLVGSFGDVAAPTSSYPQGYIALDANVYFFAAGGLWKIDGSAATLVRQFYTPFARDSDQYDDNDYEVVVFNGALYFPTTDDVHGRELWRSDGTPQGTTLVKDIFPGPAGSQIGDLTVAGNQLFFRASDAAYGYQLWRSDGTDAGTQSVDSADDTLSYVSEIIATTGNCVAFAGSGTNIGTELWQSCGTPATTTLVKDIYTGTSSSGPSDFVYFNGTLYFSARNAANGYQLWKSDLTAANTVQLSSGGSINGIYPRDITLIPAAAQIIFSAEDGVHGREPWFSNGTPGGTKLLIDINPGSDGSNPENFFTIPGASPAAVVFSADDGTHGQELWFSTGVSTNLIKDINPGPNGSYPSMLYKLPNENRWFFSADDGTHGNELWQTSDFTADSTKLVQDILPGPASSLGSVYNGSFEPGNVVALGQALYFSANNGETGFEPFRVTTAGAALIADIVPGRAGFNYTPIGVAGGQLFFSGAPQDLTLGYDQRDASLWQTGNGSTTALQNYIPVDYAEPLTDEPTVAIGNKLYFAARQSTTGSELWVSDGSVAGTTLVADMTPGSDGSYPRNLINVNGVLYFSAETPATGWKLWRLDANGLPQLVPGLAADATDSYPDNLTVVDGTLFFTASTPQTGEEWWRLGGDGTAQLVQDFNPGPNDSILDQKSLVIGDALYVYVYDGVSQIGLWHIAGNNPPVLLKNTPISNMGREFQLFDWGGTLGFVLNENQLWRSDGTPAGTTQIATLSSAPSAFAYAGGRLFYVDNLSLFASDGTAAGTKVVLSNPFPGANASGNIGQLTAVGSRVVFTATTPANGNELWTSDGTAEGTTQIELVPGAVGALPLNLAVPIPGGKAIFSAQTPDNGRELWATDGTAGGTLRLTDIAAGPANSNPRNVTLVGDQLYFQARDADGTAGLYSIGRGAVAAYSVFLPLARN